MRLPDFDGYPLPGGLDAWTTCCEKYYASWGRTITCVIGNGPALNNKGLDCYASFSSNGVVPQKRPLTLLYGDNSLVSTRANYIRFWFLYIVESEEPLR